MQILLLCDDYWHPAEVIEQGILSLKSTHDFTVVKTAKDILTPEYIAKFPLIICCKGNALNAANTTPWFEPGVTEVMPADFEAYVKNGGGFLSLHAGNSFREGEPYADFVGNHFLGHPPRCSVEVKTTHHSVFSDIPDFTVRDEHYAIALNCTDADVFCKTVSKSGGEQIGGYTRTLGAGRLCAFTLGHVLSVWENVHFQAILNRAIFWCAGQVG